MMSRKMKHSGIEWLGEIPKDWEEIRLKYATNFVAGFAFKTEDFQSEGDFVIKIGDINPPFVVLNETSKVNTTHYENAKLLPYQLKKGDYCLAMTGATIGKIGIVNFENSAYINQRVAKIGIKDNFDRNFIYYLLCSASFYEYILVHIDSQSAQPNISNGTMQEFRFFLPPLATQTAIANFLDNKCQQIDQLIQNEENTIAELKEYKKSLIQKTIEKNCDKWKEHRFTNLFSLGKGLGITKADLQDEGIPVVNYGEIHSKYGRELNPDIHTLKNVKHAYLETDEKSLLNYGDFVFADTSEDLEGAGNFTFLNSKTPVFAGYHTIIARPKIKVNFLFLSYLCDSYKFRQQIQSQVTGIKVFSITKGLLKKINVWLPNPTEQTQIATYLDKKNGEIDNLISLKQQKIAELKEYKKSLIYECVTGKKEVEKYF